MPRGSRKRARDSGLSPAASAATVIAMAEELIESMKHGIEINETIYGEITTMQKTLKWLQKDQDITDKEILSSLIALNDELKEYRLEYEEDNKHIPSNPPEATAEQVTRLKKFLGINDKRQVSEKKTVDKFFCQSVFFYGNGFLEAAISQIHERINLKGMLLPTCKTLLPILAKYLPENKKINMDNVILALCCHYQIIIACIESSTNKLTTIYVSQITDTESLSPLAGRAGLDEKIIYFLTEGDKYFSASGQPTREMAGRINEAIPKQPLEGEYATTGVMGGGGSAGAGGPGLTPPGE